MRLIITSLVFLLLSACGGAGQGQAAADTCMVEINKRLEGKTIELDVGQLAATAVASASAKDTWNLSSPIIFDRGLASEYTQVVKCKVRFEGKTASLLSLEFIWSMDALKMDE